MREIEYRAKDVATGKWVFGYYSRQLFPATAKVAAAICRVHDDGLRNIVTEVDEKTVGLWSSKLDYRKKRIYAGDIVRHRNGGYVGVVEFTGCQFVMKTERGDLLLKGFMSEIELEVVGNVFDNPDLLS